jgi:hypothetical protein
MSHHTLLDLSRWQWARTAAMHITSMGDSA